MELDAVKQQKFIHLTTVGRKTGKPHTVELWFAVADDVIYLSHEGEKTDWIRNLIDNPDVSFTIGDVSSKGEARIVRTGPSRERGKVALYEKYYGKAGKAIIDDWFSLSRVIAVKPPASHRSSP